MLALESEDHQKHSLLKSRVERYFDLDVGQYGISLTELFGLPRDVVELVFQKATDLKAKKTKSNSKLQDDLEGEMRRLSGN